MALRDSVDKIVGYFDKVSREPFTYKGVEYLPQNLHVSPMLFRGFTCPEICGGCCPRFSLDYLPQEEKPKNTSPREIVINNKKFTIHSDLQIDHEDHHCRNLNKVNGRCGIYLVRPFSCDFELIRFLQSHLGEGGTLIQKLYGRGWNMLRIDGERGAKCEMTQMTKETTLEVVRKLKRLNQWMDYFQIRNCIPRIIKWAETGPHIEPLYINKDLI